MREAIVLAGGFGTRLKKLVHNVPKPMAIVAGRPFLEILLDLLEKKGFERIILSIGFMGQQIKTHFGNSYHSMELVYVVEDEPLGTGGAIKLAMKQVRSDCVYVLNGDTFIDIEADEIETQWGIHRRPIIIAREVPDTSRYGRLVVASGILTEFIEKKQAGPGLVNAGCYLLNHMPNEAFPDIDKFSFEERCLGPGISRGEFDVFLVTGKFIDIGVPEDYIRAQTELI